MAYDYSELLQQAKHWANHAHATGWINTAAVDAFDNLEATEHLFANSNTRPLIVAFMGGTGVGKSALLNRLAGQAIAKSGIERPTSREVTLFYYQALELPKLAEQLPLTKINLAQHTDAAKQNIIWIDMPDFDSTELANKQQVLSWLPHIDVLIYVVSPERYRDEKAWRLLLQEGAKHAWLFVFNQLDRGQTEQLTDFEQQLHKAGFVEPMIFKTCCVEELNDDFEPLKNLLLDLAKQNTVAQLTQRGTQQRKLALQHQLKQTLNQLGDSNAFSQLKTTWQNQWQATTKQLKQGMAYSIKQQAEFYGNHANDLLSTNEKPTPLWDDWANSRFHDALNELIDQADQQNLAIAPLKHALHEITAKTSKQIQQQIELSVRVALANPAKAWHRHFLKFIKVCEITLPMFSMAWVSYQVFTGYYHSNHQEVPYLGVDFAIHSVLLIVLTWLIPFFVLQKAQPSLKKAALRGLNDGLTGAFALLDAEIINAINSVNAQHQQQREQLEQLIRNCAQLETLYISETSPLKRMLL